MAYFVHPARREDMPGGKDWAILWTGDDVRFVVADDATPFEMPLDALDPIISRIYEEAS